MPNTLPSPFMGMPVPVPGVDPGPDWAQNIVASLSIADMHDHSTGKGAPITGPITGSPITDATIDNSLIGGTTPAAATFTTASIGPSGFPFKMQRYTGTNVASGATGLLTASEYTTFFGAIGVTSYAGGSANIYTIGAAHPTSSTTNTNYLVIVAGEIEIQNFDSANANTFDVTLFYF